MSWTFTQNVREAQAVTALPGSPEDGDQIIFMDSLTAPTYAWLFRYIAAKSSNKWQFIGGPEMSDAVTATESTTSASYVALTTAGPSVTVPVAGDYYVTIGHNGTGAGNEGAMSYDIGASAATDADAIFDYAYSGGQIRKKKTGLTAVTLTAKYRSTNGTPQFSQRFISILPIAVGG